MALLAQENKTLTGQEGANLILALGIALISVYPDSDNIRLRQALTLHDTDSFHPPTPIYTNAVRIGTRLMGNRGFEAWKEIMTGQVRHPIKRHERPYEAAPSLLYQRTRRENGPTEIISMLQQRWPDTKGVGDGDVILANARRLATHMQTFRMDFNTAAPQRKTGRSRRL